MAADGASSLYIEVRNPQQADAGHIEYEVCCLYEEGSRLRRENHKWSVWRRYNDFAELDMRLRDVYSWQMRGIKLPKKKTFGNKAPAFVQKRCADLQQYLRELLKIDHFAEFESHLSSENFKAFINFTARTHGMSQARNHVVDGTEEARGPVVSDRSGPAGTRKKRAPRARKSIRTDQVTIKAHRESGIGQSQVSLPAVSVDASARQATAPNMGSMVLYDSDDNTPKQTNGTKKSVPAPPARTRAPAPAPARAPAPAPAPAPKPAPAPAPAAAPPAVAAAIPADVPPPQAGRNDLLASIRGLRKE